MTKADIVAQIYEKIGLSKKEASDILEIVLGTIKGTLKEAEIVKIAGFGNFLVRKKGARKGRNPKSGEEIEITPRKVVTFKPSIVFKGLVNR
ncbi:MAG: integration host factor subunit alpha [Nitrospirota bacterium]